MDPVVEAVLEAIRHGRATEVKLKLHPYLHWTAPGVTLRGRTNVLAYLAEARDHPAPDEYELRDGQIYRWTIH
jgi:hypothetical protein